jgi:hypothetical protein
MVEGTELGREIQWYDKGLQIVGFTILLSYFDAGSMHLGSLDNILSSRRDMDADSCGPK